MISTFTLHILSIKMIKVNILTTNTVFIKSSQLIFEQISRVGKGKFLVLSDTLSKDILKTFCTQHCVKSVRIRCYSVSHFSLIFPHSDLSVFSPNAGKCEKNADWNNSEYGPLRSPTYKSKQYKKSKAN